MKGVGKSAYNAATIAALLILAACTTTKTPPPETPKQVNTMCGKGSPLDAADQTKLCATLASLHEPALPEGWQSGAPVYRALLMTPQQPIISIRFETDMDGKSGQITVRRLADGSLNLDRVVKLNAAETKEFAALADSDITWKLPLNSDAPTFAACKEPSILVAEADAKGQYVLSLSHCAAMKPLEDFVIGFFNLANAKLPELSRGLETSID